MHFFAILTSDIPIQYFRPIPVCLADTDTADTTDVFRPYEHSKMKTLTSRAGLRSCGAQLVGCLRGPSILFIIVHKEESLGLLLIFKRVFF